MENEAMTQTQPPAGAGDRYLDSAESSFEATCAAAQIAESC